MKNAILFDLDGTLLDTLGDLADAVNYSTAKFDYKPLTKDDVRKRIGNGILNLIKQSVNPDEPNIDTIFNDFKLYYKDNCCCKTEPYPLIKDILLYIKEKGVKLVVVTNKAIEMATKIINYYFPNTFDLIVGDLMGLKRKPDVEMINYVLETLNINIKDILYIGDSDVDVKTCINCGCDKLIVSYGFRPKEELLKLTDSVLETQEELFNSIKNFF